MKDPDLAETSAGQKHSRKMREVVGGRKETCMPRYPAHPLGGRIVDYSTEHLSPSTVSVLCRRYAALERGRRRKKGILHADGFEYLLVTIRVERFSAHPPDDFAERYEIDIAVKKTRPRRGERRLVNNLF